MKVRIPVLVALIATGCAQPPGSPVEPTSAPVQAAFIDRFLDCEQEFLDGTAFDCNDAALERAVLAGVPAGWTPEGQEVATRYDRVQVYTGPSLPSEGQQAGIGWGIWFELSNRSDGDFASPGPTQYGGVAQREGSAPFAWQSPAHRGFVVAPDLAPGPLESPYVDLVVHVPVIHGNHTRVVQGALIPRWFSGAGCEGCAAFRVLGTVVIDERHHHFHPTVEQCPRPTRGVHEVCQPMGYTMGVFDDGHVAELHVYQLLSGRSQPWG